LRPIFSEASNDAQGNPLLPGEEGIVAKVYVGIVVESLDAAISFFSELRPSIPA
jgi:hypothetical protein